MDAIDDFCSWLDDVLINRCIHPFMVGDFTPLFQVGDLVHHAIDSSNQRRRYSQVHSINRCMHPFMPLVAGHFF